MVCLKLKVQVTLKKKKNKIPHLRYLRKKFRLSNLNACEGYVQCRSANVMLSAHVSAKTSVSDIYCSQCCNVYMLPVLAKDSVTKS